MSTNVEPLHVLEAYLDAMIVACFPRKDTPQWFEWISLEQLEFGYLPPIGGGGMVRVVLANRVEHLVAEGRLEQTDQGGVALYRFPPTVEADLDLERFDLEKLAEQLGPPRPLPARPATAGILRNVPGAADIVFAAAVDMLAIGGARLTDDGVGQLRSMLGATDPDPDDARGLDLREAAAALVDMVSTVQGLALIAQRKLEALRGRPTTPHESGTARALARAAASALRASSQIAESGARLATFLAELADA